MKTSVGKVGILQNRTPNILYLNVKKILKYNMDNAVCIY